MLSETDVGTLIDIVLITLTVQLALKPFTVVAVIFVVPVFFPLTLPKLTVATSSLLLFHVIFLSTASLGDTVASKDKNSYNSTLPLVIFNEIDVGVTSLTLTVHLALNPFTVVAVIVAVPMPSPVTAPWLFTAATLSSLLVHVTVLS